MATETFEQFMADYAGGDRPVIEWDLDLGDPSPFIVVRHGKFTMVLNPMGLSDHLCVDAHAFVEGKDATTGVFAMSNGRRTALAATLGTTSHKWRSGGLVALLLGEQDVDGEVQ